MVRRKTRNRGRPINPVFDPNRRIPRTPRPKVKFDGTSLTGSIVIPATATSGGAGSDWHFISSNFNLSISRDHTAIVDSYQDYVYDQVTFHWLPKVGPADVQAGLQFGVAYLDNAEDMFFAMTATAAQMESLVLSTSKPFLYNAWERCSYNIPLTKRRKTFAVDSSVTEDINRLERDSQGMIVIFFKGGPAIAASVGSYYFTYTMRLTGLASNPGT